MRLHLPWLYLSSCSALIWLFSFRCCVCSSDSLSCCGIACCLTAFAAELMFRPLAGRQGWHGGGAMQARCGTWVPCHSPVTWNEVLGVLSAVSHSPCACVVCLPGGTADIAT